MIQDSSWYNGGKCRGIDKVSDSVDTVHIQYEAQLVFNQQNRSLDKDTTIAEILRV